MISDDLMGGSGRPSIYLNIVLQLNERFGQLMNRLDALDLRAMYLKNFELVLSMALPRDLSEYKQYTKVSDDPRYGLPDDPTGSVTYDVFAAWVTAFTEIMRAEGIVGRKSFDVVGDDDDDAAQ